MEKLMFKNIYCLNKFLMWFDRSIHNLTNDEWEMIIDRFVLKGELMLQGYYLKQMDDYISIIWIAGETKNVDF